MISIYRTSIVLVATVVCALVCGCGKSAPDEGPAVVARKYLAARTWSERLAHVLDPQSVAAVLTARGVDLNSPLEPFDAEQPLEVHPADFERLELGQLAVVRTAKSLIDPALKRGYRGIDEIYVFKTEDGYRVDDHATWGRNPVTIDQLRQLGPDVTLKLRVMAKPDKRFTTGQNKDRLSMHLAFPTETWIGASAARDSEAGQRLKQLLAGEQPHKVVLEVRTTGRPGWVLLEVNRVLQEGWAFWDPTGEFMNQWAGPTQASVEVGEVVVRSGQFTADRIRGNLMLHVEDIRACYKQGLAIQAGLRGEIGIRAQIMLDGSVHLASVTQTIPGDPGVGKCLADKMMTWTINNPDNWKRSVADITFVLGR